MLLKIITLVLGLLFFIVIWRFDSKKDNKFALASKIASVLLLGILVYNLFVDYNSWALDIFFTLGPIGVFLIIITVEGMIEFPEWKDWYKYW